MKPKIDYSLYLVTDRDLMSTATLEEAVEKAILGGVTLVQLREKDASARQFYEVAKNIKDICLKYNVPLIINDNANIANAVNADGVHVGQSDTSPAKLRKIIGADKIVGVSVSNATEAVQAAKDGADYLGVSAMFATDTKTDAKTVSFEELAKIRRAVDIPLVVIGGINEKTIPLFKGTGINGPAVVSAIIAQPDITAAAKKLKKLFWKIFK
ncbi:thiamine-phosphate pyrophosphorylase [Elusimicrobium posterum]|uniref:thiamine phosphate synthase n=1 Tax=Elusimicrobium posterum TaxID=3116653 RepID=UPI003C72CBA2